MSSKRCLDGKMHFLLRTSDKLWFEPSISVWQRATPILKSLKSPGFYPTSLPTTFFLCHLFLEPPFTSLYQRIENNLKTVIKNKKQFELLGKSIDDLVIGPIKQLQEMHKYFKQLQCNEKYFRKGERIRQIAAVSKGR